MKKTMLKITQTRSIIGSQREKHRTVMRSLGFRKNQQTLYKNDTPQIRGMIQKVRHLVVWEEIGAEAIPAPAKRSAGFSIIEGKRADKGARKRRAEKAEAAKKTVKAGKTKKAKTAGTARKTGKAGKAGKAGKTGKTQKTRK